MSEIKHDAFIVHGRSATWRKSSGCPNNAACVEVGYVNGSPLKGTIMVRDSKDPDGPILEFTPEEWDAFIGAVKIGEFDLPLKP